MGITETSGKGKQKCHDPSGKPLICFVMPYHPVDIRRGGGGAEVQAWLLARECARRGFPTCYLCSSLSQRSGEEVIDEVRVRWLPACGRFRWSAVPRWYRALVGINPGIVVQRMSAPSCCAAMRYCKKSGARYAWICTGDGSSFRWANVKRAWVGIWRSSKNIKSSLKKVFWTANSCIDDILTDYGISRATYAFSQSEMQAQNITTSYNLQTERIFSGHSSPDRVFPVEQRRRNGNVLWVGNFGENKRPEVVCKLAAKLQGMGVKFIMIGGHSNTEVVNRLKSLMPENLRYLGRLGFEETLRWFDEASVLVNSSFTEGFPNTFVQAWLRGVPVVSLTVDPDGLLSRAKLGFVGVDLPGTAESVTRLLFDPTLYEEYSTRVRDYALKHYTIERAADSLLTPLGLA